MRSGAVLALSVALAFAGACKREPAPAAPVPATPAVTAPAPAPAATPAPQPTRDRVFGKPQLDQMLAPIALYPDALLAQVLMAATYPGDIAEAVAWSRARPDAKGEEAVREVAGKAWDPSVQSLVAFPQVLAMLGQDYGWVQRLGDAFLAQPDDVMDAVQRLRHRARQAGYLRSNEYQNVGESPAEEGAPGATPADDYAQDITIEPVDEDVVYVPAYDPMQVYGSWEDPYYLPEYYPPLAGYYPGGVLRAGLAFGIGMAIIDSLWGDVDWNDGHVDIDRDRYNRLHVDHHLPDGDARWRHDPVNRDGVPYRDRINRELYSPSLAGAPARDAFRGDLSPERLRSREQARAAMQSPGVHTPSNSRQRAAEDALAAELEAANAQQRAMAVQSQQEREREASRLAQLGEQAGRNGPGDVAAAVGDRAQEAERQRAVEQERVQLAARERQAADELRARREAEDRIARHNALQGVRDAEAARADYERGRASQMRRQQGQRGGGPVSRPARR